MSNSWKRPKIKIVKTKSEWLWDILGYSFYVGSFLFLIYNWNELPDKVPAHYNALGEIDRWGSKMELFLLPIIGAVMAVLMQLLERFPETHNYPTRLNEENAKEFYLLSRKLVNQLKNLSLIFFALLLIESITTALGWGNGIGIWFLPIIIISVLIPIVLGLMKQKRIK